ncbi:MAG: transglycosylase family protein [Actinomycetota bacterium]|nr:transglycosylase family protein [Actinomycetota bacterium]
MLFNSWRYPAAFAVAVGITFPALAVAANGSGEPADADAKPRQATQLRSPGAGPLIRPARQLDRTIQVQVKAIRAEKSRKHKQAFGHLPGGVSLSTLNAIAACESGGNPHAISSGGSYRGKYQFDYGTWASVGGHGDPAKASEAEQDYRAALLYSRSGSSPWPICG